MPLPLLQARVLLLTSDPLCHNSQPLLTLLHQKGESHRSTLLISCTVPFQRPLSSHCTVLPHHQPARLQRGRVPRSSNQLHLPPPAACCAARLTHSSWLCHCTVSAAVVSALVPRPLSPSPCRLRPSASCGPFRGDANLYTVIQRRIDSLEACASQGAASFFTSAGFIAPIVIMLM